MLVKDDKLSHNRNLVLHSLFHTLSRYVDTVIWMSFWSQTTITIPVSYSKVSDSRNNRLEFCSFLSCSRRYALFISPSLIPPYAMSTISLSRRLLLYTWFRISIMCSSVKRLTLISFRASNASVSERPRRSLFQKRKGSAVGLSYKFLVHIP